METIMEAIVSYLHYVGFMGMFACLVSEHFYVKEALPVSQAKRLAVIHRVHWISLLISVITGFMKLTQFGPGMSYYMKNGIFHGKLTLFLLVAVFSFLTSLQIAKACKAPTSEGVVCSKATVMFVRMQLLFVGIMPLLGVLIARGVGAK